jgi:hypothetical protein
MTARILLMRLSCRTSTKGTEYVSGYLGCARVVAFCGKMRDRYGSPVWELFVAEPESKGDQRRDLPVRGQGTWDASRDLPTGDGETRLVKKERRDPREQAVQEWAARFDERWPDEAPGF